MEALRRVRNARLRLEVSGGWPADPARAVVVEQTPTEATRVRIGSAVVVQVLPQQLALPSPQVPSPQVLPQVPPPQVAPPSVPTPQREDWVVVPELRQRPLLDAQKRVKDARLELEVRGGWPADPSQAEVREQAPMPGSRVAAGSIVRLVVRPKQPPLVTVPELREHTLLEARQLAKGARLELRVRGDGPADETRTVVVGQRPSGGARVAASSVVLVELAAAPIFVPELRKQPLDEARRILNEAGFGLVVMGNPQSNEHEAQVVEQAPLPGVRAPAGSTVTVSVKVSRLSTWLIAGVGILLAAGSAVGAARWWKGKSYQGATGPSVRVVGDGDVGRQEVLSEGGPAEGLAISFKGRSDAGLQTVDPEARLVTEERRADG